MPPRPDGHSNQPRGVRKDREVVPTHFYAPLVTPAPCPIDTAEIDAALAEAEKAAGAGDTSAAAKWLQVADRLQLAVDRWAVRHGPMPFIAFMRLVRPDLIVGLHHRVLAKDFVSPVDDRAGFLLPVFLAPARPVAEPSCPRPRGQRLFCVRKQKIEHL